MGPANGHSEGVQRGSEGAVTLPHRSPMGFLPEQAPQVLPIPEFWCSRPLGPPPAFWGKQMWETRSPRCQVLMGGGTRDGSLRVHRFPQFLHIKGQHRLLGAAGCQELPGG